MDPLLTTRVRMKTRFDHEKLDVYQESIRLVSWVDELLGEIPRSLAVHNPLDRASTSIPLNIAEGNGIFTAADRCRFFDEDSAGYGTHRTESTDQDSDYD